MGKYLSTMERSGYIQYCKIEENFRFTISVSTLAIDV
jgi:hypothetical protein